MDHIVKHIILDKNQSRLINQESRNWNWNFRVQKGELYLNGIYLSIKSLAIETGFYTIKYLKKTTAQPLKILYRKTFKLNTF